MSERMVLQGIRFPLGRVVATPGALSALQDAGKTPQEFLQRHAHCDWSEMSIDDATANTIGLLTYTRIFSSYKVGVAGKVWVITEADRSVTTLLPSDY